MAVNYRIALGKFGIDLEDGEVRLEEVIPVANDVITFEQFQLAFGSLLQVAVIYQSLLHHIVIDNLTPQEALSMCEQEFLEESSEQGVTTTVEQRNQEEHTEAAVDLNVDEVMEEVTRLLEERKE